MSDQQTLTSKKKILRVPIVCYKIGMSRAWLYAAIKSGEFPPPLQLSSRSIGWEESLVDSWIDSRLPKEVNNVR
jgi:prophage regulatory protein